MLHALLVFGAAGLAGVLNSLAGGGTLISFPTLIWLGVGSVAANATSTVALWPGSLGSVWGYRRELRAADPRVYALVVPSLLGGIVGAMLLFRTPTAVFDRLVPILILFATGLFMAQEPIQRRYGGYFGAGIGILMLAALSIMGHTDIHQMNAQKNLLAVCMNGIAAVYFSFSGLVVWNDALVMAAGAILGGVAGAGLARRMGRAMVRRVVVIVGLVMALSLMLRL